MIEHVHLADAATRRDEPARMSQLTPREQEVLDLMARGLSNAATYRELHLSIKTVEPAVGRIFDKLGLHHDAARNRRVLAVLAYLHRDDVTPPEDGLNSRRMGSVSALQHEFGRAPGQTRTGSVTPSATAPTRSPGSPWSG